jgi:hypothetical protein
VLLTRDELERHLTTQSNVIAAVDEERESLGEVEGGLTEVMAPLFTDPRGAFRFGSPIWYL